MRHKGFYFGKVKGFRVRVTSFFHVVGTSTTSPKYVPYMWHACWDFDPVGADGLNHSQPILMLASDWLQTSLHIAAIHPAAHCKQSRDLFWKRSCKNKRGGVSGPPTPFRALMRGGRGCGPNSGSHVKKNLTRKTQGSSRSQRVLRVPAEVQWAKEDFSFNF